MFTELRQPLTRIATCLACLLCISVKSSNAHPTSHVDAWLRVGNQLNVRLTLFLDDILATQNIVPVRDMTLLPATTVRTALTEFEKDIPDLFAIYDTHGEERLATVALKPRWKSHRLAGVLLLGCVATN